MATVTQTLNIPAGSWLSRTARVGWNIPSGQRLSIDDDFAPPGEDRFFATCYAYTDGSVELRFTSAIDEFSGSTDDDLVELFEAGGSVTIEAVGQGQSITVVLDGSDADEPYVWTPANSAAVTAFANALNSSGDGTVAGRLTLTFEAFDPVEMTLTPQVTAAQHTSNYEGAATADLTLTPRAALAVHADHHISEILDPVTLTLTAQASGMLPTPGIDYTAVGMAPVTMTLEARLVFPFVAPVRSAMGRWLLLLRLPWSDLPRRWAMTEAIAEIGQRLEDSAVLAVREWWPLLARDGTLPTWGRTLRRPRYSGETVATYRGRLAEWKNEPVGTSGWVLSEVTRITGTDPAPVLEFPRQSGRWGYGQWGTGRWGAGPLVVVGVDPSMRSAVEACLDEGVPWDVGISYLAPDVFQAVLDGPTTP